MESEHFIFNGVHSRDMNISVVRLSTGFVETPIWGDRKISESGAPGRLTPYLHSVEGSPISFTLELALVDDYNRPMEWTADERFRIANWLLQDTYKPFQTEDDLEKVYYAICTGTGDLNLMRTEGYMQVTFRTNSPYAWSVEKELSFDLSENTETSTIILHNGSNVVSEYLPKIELEMKGSTGVTLQNITTGDKKFQLKDLRTHEIISIDNANRLIKSSMPININPLSNFNRGWLKLKSGDNYIEVVGKCIITVKLSYPIAQ